MHISLNSVFVNKYCKRRGLPAIIYLDVYCQFERYIYIIVGICYIVLAIASAQVSWDGLLRKDARFYYICFGVVLELYRKRLLLITRPPSFISFSLSIFIVLIFPKEKRQKKKKKQKGESDGELSGHRCCSPGNTTPKW